MRVRTDTRRQAILSQAAAVFRQSGYERTSMAQIAGRVGGSKTTLYGYFKSKQELFAAVMHEALKAQSDALGKMLAPDPNDLRASLIDFGRAYLDFVLSPEVIAIVRVGIADAEAAGIGPKVYALGPADGLENLAQFVRSCIERGLLREAPPGRVAAHLRALLESEVVEPALYGMEPAADRTAVVEGAIDAFLRAYGTKTIVPRTV